MFRRVLPLSRKIGAGVIMCAATTTLAGVLYHARSALGSAYAYDRKPCMPCALNSGPASVVPSSGSPKVGEKLMPQ